ncbi:DNA-binding response regulator [Micromonospora sp. HM5-17]|jgi:two-component system response regulator DesR|nr:DNA-binding response regulator [Micromonospora sp. HM5-17]
MESAEPAAPIRVALVEDEAFVREAFVAMLQRMPNIEVVGAARSAREAVALALRTMPDVMLVDIRILGEPPLTDGIEVVRALARTAPAIGCLVLTTFGSPGEVRRALAAGARGFLVKDTRPPQVYAAIQDVAAGGHAITPSLAAAVVRSDRNPLTARELDVLRLSRTYSTVRAVAEVLHLAEGTVRNYLSSAIGKLGARNRFEAVRTAEDQGWL